jgi:chaperonin GroEL
LSKGVSSNKTKDGISVLKFLSFNEPLESIGLQMIKEASNKVAYLAGDGTTTTALLTAELSKSANDLINKGFNIRDIKSGFE